MADGTDLASIYASLGLGNPTATANDLSSFQNNVLSTDPWNIAAKSLGSFQPNMSTWSPTTQVATSFGKNFLAGLMGQYARNDATEQLNSVVNVMPQLRKDPLSVMAPEGVDESAFGTLKSNLVLKNLEAKAQAEAAKQSNIAELFKAIGIEGVKAGTLDPKNVLTAMSTGKLEDLGGGVVDPLKNPNSNQFKMAAAIKAEEDAARNEILTAAKYPAVAKFNTTSTALSQLKDIKDLNTASSDIPFATLFIGGLDGSVVREGEYARVAGANPFLDKFKNQLEGALNGTSTLGVDIKRQMYNELVKTQKGLLTEAMIQASPRLNTAIERGGLAKNILPFDPNMKFDSGVTVPDKSVLQTEAAALKAQGMSPTDIAATLRSKYGG